MKEHNTWRRFQSGSDRNGGDSVVQHTNSFIVTIIIVHSWLSMSVARERIGEAINSDSEEDLLLGTELSTNLEL